MAMEIDSDTHEDEYHVRWPNHHGKVLNELERFYGDETYADCSLASDDDAIPAHKIILSSCSPYLNKILSKHHGKHPVIVMRDIAHEDLMLIIEYMYRGEVLIPRERLTSFVKAAGILEISSLTDFEKEVLNEAIFKDKESEPPLYSQGGCNEPEEIEPSAILKFEDVIVSGVDMDYLPEAGEIDEKRVLGEVMDEETVKNHLEKDINWILVNEDEIENVDENNVITLKEVHSVENIGNTIGQPTVDPLLMAETTTPVRRRKRKKNSPDPLPPFMARKQKKTDSSSIPCKNCGSSFKNESTFIGHLRHDCNQVHECEACSHVFKNRRHLLDHMRDDCGRIHVCSLCTRQFKQKVNLTTHQKHYCRPENSPSRIRAKNLESVICIQEDDDVGTQ